MSSTSVAAWPPGDHRVFFQPTEGAEDNVVCTGVCVGGKHMGNVG